MCLGTSLTLLHLQAAAGLHKPLVLPLLGVTVNSSHPQFGGVSPLPALSTNLGLGVRCLYPVVPELHRIKAKRSIWGLTTGFS